MDRTSLRGLLIGVGPPLLLAEAFNFEAHSLAWAEEDFLGLLTHADARGRAGGNHVAGMERHELG
jgi:hypothetical protein